LAKGNASAAEAPLTTLNSAMPDRPLVQVEMARLHLAKGNRSAARASFQAALVKDPSQTGALEGLTIMDLQDKKNAEARARIEAAAAASPRNDRVQLLAGRTYAALGDAAAAERAYKQALELNPNNLRVYAAIGQLYAGMQRLPEATQQFEKLAERQPNAVGPHTAVALLLQLQNRREEAKARYEKVLQLDPRAGVAANNLAWMYAEDGANLNVALQLAQTAKAQLSDLPEVNDTLGWIYHKKGLPELAVGPLRESVAKDPNNAMYHLHLGLVYASAGDGVKARESLERALTLKLSAEDAAEAKKALAGLKG
jgi:tetratricopeptide (TPR) repeat protein